GDVPRTPTVPEHRVEGVGDSAVRPRGPRVHRGPAAPRRNRQGGPWGRGGRQAARRLLEGTRDRHRIHRSVHGPRSVPRRGDSGRGGVPEPRGGGRAAPCELELPELREPRATRPSVVPPGGGARDRRGRGGGGGRDPLRSRVLVQRKRGWAR